jgi:hypothetical protein
MYLTFRVVRVGELFMSYGNMYIKKSTRTARMVGHDQRTFYFKQLDTCSL